MAMVQSLNESQFQTFNDLGEVVIRKLLKIINDLTLSVSDAAFVFDRYDNDSIKAMERSRRGGGGGGGEKSYQAMSSLELVLFQIINNSSNLMETRLQSLLSSVYM